MRTLKEILAEQNKLGSDMRALHEAAEKEERGFNSDEKEKWAKMTARMNELREEETRAREIEENERRFNTPANSLPSENRDGNDGSDADDGDDDRNAAIDLEQRAFSALLRSTEPGRQGLPEQYRSALSQMEQRAQSVGTASAGGYLVPEGFGGRLIETMKAFGGVINEATIIDTASGNDLPFPTDDDTTNIGAIVAENVQHAEQDLTFGQKTLGAYLYSSKIVRVSFQLMQDSFFDMDAYLARKLGQRIGRASAAHFATGTGSGQPEGIAVGSGTGVTAAAVAAITFADLVGLEHSVDPAYRQMGAKFVFNDATLKALQETADSEGRPLWLPRVGDAVPATIYGYEYVIDQGIADIGASAVSAVFGYLPEYYVRMVTGVQLLRLVERYADYAQVGFLAFQRMDGAVMDSSAIKKLTHPAS